MLVKVQIPDPCLKPVDSEFLEVAFRNLHCKSATQIIHMNIKLQTLTAQAWVNATVS